MVDAVMGWIETLMLTEWIYPIVGSMIFLDCFIPVMPSEVPLNMVGAWAGSQGVPHIPTMFFVAVGCAMLGDNLCYALGGRLMPLINRAQKGSKPYEALQWAKRNMRSGAGAAIIIARFIPSARLFMTIFLGAMRYSWPMFFFFDTIGVMLWAAQALAVGYLGGVLFGGNPAIAMIISIIAAFVLGWALQKAQNSIANWWDTRRGFAETP